MNVAGIDYNTQSIDVVLVDVDDLEPRWFHWELCAVGDAFERLRVVPNVMPARRSAFWDNVLAVGIEEPMARDPKRRQLVAKLKAVQGAIVACIPPQTAVVPLDAKSWRAEVGLPGNASKDMVAVWCIGQIAMRSVARGITADGWSQDAFDAYVLARATMNRIEEGRAA